MTRGETSGVSDFRLWALVVTMTLAAAVTAPRAQEPRDNQNRTAERVILAGLVLSDEPAPQPLHAAVVTLSGDGHATSVTGDDGRFEFRDLAPGRYTLTVSKAAWLNTQFGATRPDGPGTPITLAAGQETSDVVVRVPRGAVITGVILDLEGHPVPNLPVGVLPSIAANPVLTDDRGEYRIWGLSPGDYVVMVSPPSTASGGAAMPSAAAVNAMLAELERTRSGAGRGRAAPGPSVSAATGGSLVSYSQVYYPGTASQGQALPVSVAVGEERRGIDFALMLSGMSTIAGDVRYSDGRPVIPDELGDLRGPVLVVTATPRGGLAPMLPGVRPQTMLSRADGRFTIVNVPPGGYRVSARLLDAVRPVEGQGPMALPSRPTRLWAQEDVDLVSTDVSKLTLTLRPAMTISGRIAFDRSTLQVPSDMSRVQVTLTAATTGRDEAAPPSAATETRADGTFEITGILPGTYRLSASVPGVAGWWARSANHNQIDLLDHPPEMGPESGDLRDVVVTLTGRVAELAGTFQSPTGAPAPEHFIVAFPPDRTLWHHASRRLVFTRPATDGYFVLRNLPSGDYVVAALTDLDPAAWRSPDFLEQIVPTGVVVTIREGERTVQDFRITR